MKEKFNVLFGFIVILAITIGVIELLKLLLETLSTINPTVGTGLIAAATSIFISVISVLYAKRLEYKSILMKEHRDKKIPFYEDIVKFMLGFVYAEKLGSTPLTEQEIIIKIASFTENLIIWGSDDVVNAWIEFRRVSVNNGEQPNIKIVFSVE